MARFEYKITKFTTTKTFDNDGDPYTTYLKDNVLTKIMNNMGDKGWELISTETLLEAIYTDNSGFLEYTTSIVDEIILFWKRRKQ